MEHKNKHNFDMTISILFSVIKNTVDIPEQKIKTVKKTRELADIRRVIITLVKEEFPETSTTKLGLLVGRKHPNVSIQLKESIKLINSDKKFNALYHNVRTEFKKTLSETKK